MEADWYEDPLGRYDGRFFDGENWTDQVSANGALVFDPDFSPIRSTPEVSAASESPVRPADVSAASESSEPPVELDFVAGAETPAVEAIDRARPLRASTAQESPARTVAVLDESVFGPPRSRWRRPLPGLLALLGLALAAAVVVWVVQRSDDSDLASDALVSELNDEQEDRVKDLEEGGFADDVATEDLESTAQAELDVDSPTGVVDSSTDFDEAEKIEVGSLKIVNGTSLLESLEDWHQGFAADRGVRLGADAGCWFGQLGGAAVQVAHCGPVSGSEDTEFLFDSVPLSFEDVEAGQIAQPVVDAASVDSRLPTALTLIGGPDRPSPLPDDVTRGERDGD